MRSKNPELMKNIYAYINHYYRDHHHEPTQREIAGAISISLSTVNRYLTALAEQGMINMDNGKVKSVTQISD